MAQAYEPCSNYRVKAFMKIGDLARTAGVKAETIRYYEREGLLRAPLRTDSNYRDYQPGDLSRLLFIRRARDLGFTTAQVKELLALADDRSRSCAAVDLVANQHLVEVNRKITSLLGLRDELGRLIAECERGSIEDCRLIDALSR